MSMLVTPTNQVSPTINKNIIKWSAYFSNTEEAKNNLESKLKHIEDIENKKIIKTDMDLVNRKCHGLFLYRFTITLE